MLSRCHRAFSMDPGTEYKQRPLTWWREEEGKSIHLRDVNYKQLREFSEGGEMIALVFMDLQEEKHTLIATLPQREPTTQLKKKKERHIDRTSLAKKNKLEREA